MAIQCCPILSCSVFYQKCKAEDVTAIMKQQRGAGKATCSRSYRPFLLSTSSPLRFQDLSCRRQCNGSLLRSCVCAHLLTHLPLAENQVREQVNFTCCGASSGKQRWLCPPRRPDCFCAPIASFPATHHPHKHPSHPPFKTCLKYFVRDCISKPEINLPLQGILKTLKL